MGERLISIEEHNATVGGGGSGDSGRPGRPLCAGCRTGRGESRAFGRPHPPVRDPSSVSARAPTRAVVSQESRRGSRGRATRESESKRGRTSDSFPTRLVIRSGRRHFHTPSRRRNRRGAAPPRTTPRVRLPNAERTRSPAKRGRLFPRAALTNIIPPPRSGTGTKAGKETARDAATIQNAVRLESVRLLDLCPSTF